MACILSTPAHVINFSEVRMGEYAVPASKEEEESITLVDLKDTHGPGKAEVLRAIRKACETDGFFQVINHGVVEGVMKETRSVVDEFFGLSSELKQHLFSEDPSKPVRVNSFVDVDTNSSREYLRLNCHSDAAAWPSAPYNFKEAIGSYTTEMEKLMKSILSLISESLGLEEDCLLNKLGGRPEQHMSMSKCKTIRSTATDQTIQLRPHRDPAVISAIHQDYHLPGLQVSRGDDKWVTVPAVKNSIVVNLGDQLEVLSNGIYKSNTHKVLVDPATGKTTSVLTLWYPPLSALIEPVPELIAKDGASPNYKAFKYQEYHDLFWKRAPMVYRCDALDPFIIPRP